MRDDKSVRRQERKAGATGVLLGSGAYLLDGLPDEGSWADGAVDYLTVPGGIAAGVLLTGSVAHNRWYFSERQRLLRDLGEGGWINRQDLRNYAGAAALYAKAEYLRPDLPVRHGRLRRHQAATEYGFGLGTLVSGERGVRSSRIYSPHGRSIQLIGPPGSGKSQKLLHLILDFPGAELVTSTKLELYDATARLRMQRGRVWLFNPEGLGDVESTFWWDPVSGCKDQAVADKRAWALVRGGGGAAGIDQSEFWAGKAQEILRAYLLAAALVGYDMGAVHYWATNPDDRTPVGILQSHPSHVPAGWIGTLESSLNASHNTRTGYFATVVSCVGFMDNPRVAMACRPREADNFDVTEFLAGGTLYAVGSESDRRLAPLLTALTEHIYDRVKAEAAKHPGGRLARGVAFMLDEVAQQTPVPLDKWAADSRGANVTIVAVLQALAQLRLTWGLDGASVIEQSLLTKIILGGVSDEHDRKRLAGLAGSRWAARTSEGKSVQHKSGGKSSSTNTTPVKEAVMEPDVLYGLPPGYAYVVGLGGSHAAVVRYEPGRKRVARELRRLGRSARALKLPQLELRREDALGAEVHP